MPRPSKGQSMKEFVSEYMGDKEANKKFPDQKQRAAVAYSLWRNRNKKKAIQEESNFGHYMTQAFQERNEEREYDEGVRPSSQLYTNKKNCKTCKFENALSKRCETCDEHFSKHVPKEKK